MLKRVFASVVMLLLIAVPFAAQEASAFEAAPCPVPMPFGFAEDTGAGGIECGFVTVPENYDAPDGTQIRLGVAIINSSSPSPAPDPLFMENGGPGGSSIEPFVQAAPLYGAVLASRDIVIVEQRGTKFSEPFLDCPEILEAIFVSFDTDELPDEAGAMQACFERLADEGVDINAYNSINNATDMISVADALGYEQINFYGVSYGTQLGQHVLRDHEDRVRSMIFDAVAPLEQNFVPDAALNAQMSMEAIIVACAEDAFCNERYPDLQTMLDTTYADLNENSPLVPIVDTATGETYEILVTGDVMIGFLRLLNYQTQLIPSLPAFIEDAAEGDFEWIENFYGAFSLTLQRDIADAMYFGVICAEDADFTSDDMMLDTLSDPFTAIADQLVLSIANTCDLAQVDLLDNFVDEPVLSDVPALIFSGEFDPITPVSYGDILEANLSNSTHLVFSGYGHSALFGGLCQISIVASFLDDPSADVDASCADAFELTFVEYTQDPTGRLQFPVPTGLSDVSTDGFAQYTNDAGDLTLSLIAIDADDMATAQSDALSTVVRDGFAVPPLQSITEVSAFGELVTNVYQDGTDLLITLSVEREGTYSVVIIQFGVAQLQAAQTVLQQVGISVLVTD